MSAAVSALALAAARGAEEAAPPASATDLVSLRLRGPLTAATAAGLRALFRDYLRLGCQRLLVDLEAVECIDASGLAALLAGKNLVEGRENGVMMLRVGPTVRRALKQTGTITAFRLWDEPAA